MYARGERNDARGAIHALAFLVVERHRNARRAGTHVAEAQRRTLGQDVLQSCLLVRTWTMPDVAQPRIGQKRVQERTVYIVVQCL